MLSIRRQYETDIMEMQKFLGLSKRKNYVKEDSLKKMKFTEVKVLHEMLMERYETVGRLKPTKRQLAYARMLGTYKSDGELNRMTRLELSNHISSLEIANNEAWLHEEAVGHGQWQ